MVSRLHNALKQFYPMNEICRLIDAHFARFDALDARSTEITSTDTALLQGVTFLVEQLQQQQKMYRDLNQRRERDYSMSRRTASLVDSLNTHLAGSVTQDQKRGDQLTAGLEQLAKCVRDSAARGEAGQDTASPIAEILRRLEDMAISRTHESPVSEETDGPGKLSQGLPRSAITMKGGHFDLENPDITLLVHLAPLLANRTAVDIGANTGAVSGRLLAAGYEVFAFEPFPPVFAQLNGLFGDDEFFHAHQLAIGYTDRTMELNIAEDVSPTAKYGDSVNLFHSLVSHPMPSDLQFARRIDVRVRSIDSLVRADVLRSEVGLIKIDTEGYDLEVIRGMGACSCQVLIAEFWDTEMIFGRSGARNRLSDLVGEMRPRGYRWHIVVYRLDNKPISYYCNQDQSIAGSWGNVIFFTDKPIFDEAVHWCAAVLPPTWFTA